MHKFEFASVGRIVFGRGVLARLPELIKPLGGPVLLVHNGPEEILQHAKAALGEPGLAIVTFRQRGEPRADDVDAAVQAARQAGCVSVIGLGGGSAIDAAKAVAGLLTNGGTALDYMEVIGKGQKIGRAAAPWIAVPTTAGTGAEATRNAVIGYPPRQFKASIRSELLMPHIALIDPELHVEVPPSVTAQSGMDALCQLIESYTSTGAQPITDALALRGIQLAARSLRTAHANGGDIDAREDMALAALLSGITLTNAGLGAVHGFAAPLGAAFPAPHGAVCAALLAPIMSANVAALGHSSPGALHRYAEIGRALTGQTSLPDEHAIEAGIGFVAELARDLSIPPLKNFGLMAADIPALVALARKSSSMRYNPVVLSEEHLGAALALAIGA